ncbi:NADH dehydrogenase [ubiquinone] 1 beta subcomplex subunit 3 isoform X1 [Rhinatrema bivittatum]|uniref:NADH dehydrogenase [ubiquinone] 1 beta subcomplex subunit 3 isoform X1 n=1 Tax=Rhinatrema bivittatum TaxID=194408 RepID=UPI0011299B49|nr:NADH dehydrogenase [ubiquinone] 1 beta subcomplex subunit 3 isoform X1 [Rhinatrema bivittatum]
MESRRNTLGGCPRKAGKAGTAGSMGSLFISWRSSPNQPWISTLIDKSAYDVFKALAESESGAVYHPALFCPGLSPKQSQASDKRTCENLPIFVLPTSSRSNCNRNEAWRFMGGYAKPVTLSQVVFRGFKWGFAAFVVALGLEYAFFPPKKNDGHH